MAAKYNIAPEVIAAMLHYGNVTPEIANEIARSIVTLMNAFEYDWNNIVGQHQAQYADLLVECKALWQLVEANVISAGDETVAKAEQYSRILSAKIGSSTSASSQKSEAVAPTKKQRTVFVRSPMPQMEVGNLLVDTGLQWARTLSDQQRHAITDYTSTAYLNINRSLRGLDMFTTANRSQAQHIHEALQSARIPHACTLYRGASKEALGSLANKQPQDIIGASLIDHGFMSTCINPSHTMHSDIQMVIDVPAGAHGAYIGYISTMGHEESEVLLDADSLMKIVDVTTDAYGRKTVHLHMII